MPINDGKYVVPAWQDGGPPAIDAAEMTAIGQSIVTNQNGVAQNTQNVSTLQQQMSTANQNIASLQQFQTTATGQIANLTNNYLPKSGGTMTGPITLPGNPSGALQAVPKQYADARGWVLVGSGAIQFGSISTGEARSQNGISLSSVTNKYDELAINVSFTNFKITSETGEEATGCYILYYLQNSVGISTYLSSETNFTVAGIDSYENYNQSYTFNTTEIYRKRSFVCLRANQTAYSVPVFIPAYYEPSSIMSNRIRQFSAITDGTEVCLYLRGLRPSIVFNFSGSIIMSIYGR